MGNIIEAQLIGTGLKGGIVVGRFNEFSTSKLLDGAVDGLKRHGVHDEEVDIACVPGAFDMPLIANKLVQTGTYDAVLGLGTVIGGATTPYDYVCNEAAKGMAAVSLESGAPVIF